MSEAVLPRRAIARAAAAGAALLASAGAVPAALAAGSSAGATSATGATGAPAAPAAKGGNGYTNPVSENNHPDPGVLHALGRYYLYSTAGSRGHMPVLVSDDLVTWEELGNAMPEIASWCTAGRHWAPEVIEIDGRFHAYYTARDTASATQAIGHAVADDPAGPFVDDDAAALLVQDEEGGCIDPSPFRDEDGALWLLWKNDGNARDLPSYLYAQRLTDDGAELVGEPTRILQQDQDWEIYTIEGPSIIREKGRYYLFYSAGEYWNESYGVGVAVADSVLGPWEKVADAPALSANDVAAGPGHGTPIRTKDGVWYVYHAWQPGHVNGSPGRQVWLSRVRFRGGRVTIDGPTTDNPHRPVV
ncbi:glycoside hydrolase family 43 protein [Brachybacterium sp. DNPG3]